MKTRSGILLASMASILVLSISGCDRYRITLNDATISEPKTLLKNIEVADAGLKSCIEQVIADKGIRYKEDLKLLNCSHGNVTSLEGIQQFTKIHTLNLGNNLITDITPLLFLGELAALNLEGNDKLPCKGLANLKGQMAGEQNLIAPEHCKI